MESTCPSPPPSTGERLRSFDCVFAYRAYLRSGLGDALEPSALRTIELHYPDGDVAVYDAAGNFLACEEGREAALHEARFVLDAFLNGAIWAEHEVPLGRGHLQKHFPEIAKQHRCSPDHPTVTRSCGP